jgi:hypothetical protein
MAHWENKINNYNNKNGNSEKHEIRKEYYCLHCKINGHSLVRCFIADPDLKEA